MSANDPITISVEHPRGAVAVVVEGEVDMFTAPILETAIAEIVAAGPPSVVIDLSAVQLLASAGMRVLAEAHKKLAGSIFFAVIADGPFTRRPIQMIGLDQILWLYQTLDDALRAISTGRESHE